MYKNDLYVRNLSHKMYNIFKYIVYKYIDFENKIKGMVIIPDLIPKSINEEILKYYLVKNLFSSEKIQHLNRFFYVTKIYNIICKIFKFNDDDISSIIDKIIEIIDISIATKYYYDVRNLHILLEYCIVNEILSKNEIIIIIKLIGIGGWDFESFNILKKYGFIKKIKIICVKFDFLDQILAKNDTIIINANLTTIEFILNVIFSVSKKHRNKKFVEDVTEGLGLCDSFKKIIKLILQQESFSINTKTKKIEIIKIICTEIPQKELNCTIENCITMIGKFLYKELYSTEISPSSLNTEKIIVNKINDVISNIKMDFYYSTKEIEEKEYEF
jgi:hypothetical protein